MADDLLQEDGDGILLEDGTEILLESEAAGAYSPGGTMTMCMTMEM